MLPGVCLARRFGRHYFRRNVWGRPQFMVLGSRKTGYALKAPLKEADERLLVEAAQRDPRRFAEIYEQNFEQIYAYIARRVENRAEAEDLTSEVFHDALEKLSRFEWRGVPFAAWLYRIASNAIADRWRRAGRESGRPAPDSADPGGSGQDEIERRALLSRLVKELPENQQSVIEMRFAEEKSIREIAVALGKTEGAVKQLQFRGIQNLRAQAGKKTGMKLGERNG